jgi:type I restriction enzyme R subunit
MTDIGQKERATQNRVIKLFRERLGYDYLGNWEDKDQPGPAALSAATGAPRVCKWRKSLLQRQAL